ncbi:MAG: TlpA family protein disulfide reductase [Gammaproteobacteria bacterium]
MNLHPLRLVRYAAVIGICILSGYYAGRLAFTDGDQTTPATSAAPAASNAAVLVEHLPDFRLEDRNGEMRSLSEWSDGPLVINFWATWCAPCLREMPLLETTWNYRKPDGLTIVGIAVDRREDVDPYLEKTAVTYPILIGQSDAMQAAEAFGPDFAGLPYTVFAAAGGRVLGVYSGELEPAELDRILTIVLDASAGRLSIDAARSLLAD